MNAQVILGLIGGLGLFLYGMKMMSDGLEKAAGAKLRSILEMFTKNRFIGMLVGTAFTAVIQSSSAATVLVVSFVNAGLMNLAQAAGVILGANIGTTVTGLLIALNLTTIAPVFLMLGVIMVMFMKNSFVRKSGEVLLGFGMLFIGMSMMSGSLEGLKDAPVVIDALSSLTNPYLAILVGFVVTAVLQSSSATVGIVILMASQGLIGLPICFYLIMGCNVGSCVSALMASLSGKKMAKRAALIHLFVNIIGTTFMVLLLAFFMEQVIQLISSLTKGVSDVPVNGINERMAKDVAYAHTIFKIIQVLIVFPFTNAIVKLTYVFVRGEDAKVDKQHLKYIGEHTVYSPTTAVPQTIREIERMGQIAFSNLDCAMSALLNRDGDKIEKVYRVEKSIDYMNEAVTKYLVRVNQLSLPVGDRKAIGGLFHVVSDIERIGDHAENLAGFARTMIEDGISFTKQGEEELKEMFALTFKLLGYSIEMFSKKSEEHLKEILDLENRIDNMERQLQKNHVARLTANICTPQSGMIFSDLVSNLERVADHGTNIAFSILEEDPED